MLIRKWTWILNIFCILCIFREFFFNFWRETEEKETREQGSVLRRKMRCIMSNEFVTSAADCFLLHPSWQYQQLSSRPLGKKKRHRMSSIMGVWEQVRPLPETLVFHDRWAHTQTSTPKSLQKKVLSLL